MTFTFKHGDQPLAGYTVQRGVGRGGFGEVYYALAESGKEVALKYLRDNPQTELRGVAHCLNLKSPYLVTIYDVKQNDDGEYFVVMEYVSGPSLRDILVDAPEGVGVEKATFFTDGIAKGLRYLHERGIVHRDMKPGNIFYEEGYVKIGDYGLSKFISPSQHSGQTMSVGTVHYMAPEIGSGHYQAGTDVYALGVMLYEMLLGRVPFQGASMGEILMKHLTQQPEVDELPEPFPGVIRKALAKDPRERFQSVDDMTAALLGRAVTRDALSRFDVSSMTLHADRVAARARAHAHVPVGAGPGGSSQLPPLPGAAEAPTVTFIPPGNRASSMPQRIGQVVETVGRQIEQTVDEVGGRLRRHDRARLANTPMFPPRDRLTAGLLGVFLGVFGAHRFYLGYTSVGIIQAVLSLVSAGTVGAIWGLIEGIVILGGGMTDIYGRPIVSRPAERRSGLIRGLWGVLSVVLLLGIVPLILVPVLVDVKGSSGFHPGIADIVSTELKQAMIGPIADGDMTQAVADGLVRQVEAPLRANTYPLSFMWAIAGVPAVLSAFCAWKASHRPGLSFWSATGRPLALALCGAAIVAAFMLAHYFKSTTPVGVPMLFVVGLFTLLGAVVWQIRGDTMPIRAEDQDRENGLAYLSLLGAVACGMAIVVIHQPPPAIRGLLSSWWDGGALQFEPLLLHGVTMVASALVVCLVLESLHRMKRYRRARALAEPATASPGSTDGRWTSAATTSKAAKAEAKRIKMEAKAEAKRLKKAGKSSGTSCCW